MCPGHTKPGTGTAKHRSVCEKLEFVKSHLGLGLQPPELPAPEGKPSVSRELIPSSRPLHLPVSHVTGGRGARGGASPGRPCREPWELHLVGGWVGGGCAHAQVHTHALLLSCSFSEASLEAGQPAGSARPRLGAHREKPPVSEMAGNRGDQPGQDRKSVV